MVLCLCLLTTELFAQRDTIYALDTIISSVRIMNQNQDEIMYFYLYENIVL